MVSVTASDKRHNSQTFYFNHGVNVSGESLNEPPTHMLFNKRSSQQTENLWLTLTRTDKVNNIWTDQLGIEYLHISESRFDRITPYDGISNTIDAATSFNAMTREHSNFDNLIDDEKRKAEILFEELYNFTPDYNKIVLDIANRVDAPNDPILQQRLLDQANRAELILEELLSKTK